MSEPKREARRKKIVEQIKNGGATPTPDEVGCSRMTLWRDLKALQEQAVLTLDAEGLKAIKQQQYQVQLRMKQALLEGVLDPTTITAWNKVRESIARLLGLNAESRAVVAHVTGIDAQVGGMYVEFNKLVGRKKKSWDAIVAFIESCPDDEEEPLCLNP
jgi:conjugal transfer/entry exclusion protein